MIAFCEVYRETQISWLADCGMSILLTIPVELISSILLASFYYIALMNKWKIVYNIVMFFYGLN